MISIYLVQKINSSDIDYSQIEFYPANVTKAYLDAFVERGLKPSHFLILEDNEPICFFPAFRTKDGLDKIDSCGYNSYGGFFYFKNKYIDWSVGIELIKKFSKFDYIQVNFVPILKEYPKLTKITNPVVLILQRKKEHTLDYLWLNVLSKKTRTAIRFAQKKNLALISGHEELLERFYPLYCNTVQESGGNKVSKEFFAALTRDATNTGITLAESDGEIIAGIAYAFGSNHAILVANCSTNKGKEFKANNFLYWKFIESCVNKNIEFIDFGPSSEPSQIHFKQGFGAKPIKLRTISIIVNPLNCMAYKIKKVTNKVFKKDLKRVK